jgi:hypothetical protein
LGWPHAEPCLIGNTDQEHEAHISLSKSLPAIAMSQIVAPDSAQQRINLLTHDHGAPARVEEF